MKSNYDYLLKQKCAKNVSIDILLDKENCMSSFWVKKCLQINCLENIVSQFEKSCEVDRRVEKISAHCTASRKAAIF